MLLTPRAPVLCCSFIMLLVLLLLVIAVTLLVGWSLPFVLAFAVLALTVPQLLARARGRRFRFDDSGDALLFAAVCCALVLLLLFRGAAALVRSSDIEDHAPAYLGVLAYRFPLEKTSTNRREAHFRLGPDVSFADTRTTEPPLLTVPWAGRGVSSEGTNPPIDVSVSCEPAPPPGAPSAASPHCRLTLALDPHAKRRDYVLSARAREPGAMEPIRAGSVTIPAQGATLVLAPRLPPALDNGATPEAQRIAITYDHEAVHLGRCVLRRPARGEPPRYLAVLDLARLDSTQPTCPARPVSDADVLEGRWIARSSDGSVDIPARSLLEIGATQVSYLPFEDTGFSVDLVDATGQPLLPASPPPIEFTVGRGAELTLWWRTFRERSTVERDGPRARLRRWLLGRSPCTTSFHDDGSCRGVDVRLEPARLTIDLDEAAGRFEVALDKSDRAWRQSAYVALLPREWTRDTPAGRIPESLLYVQGRWQGNTARRIAGLGERTLDVPFRLSGGLPYRANLSILRDSQRRTWLQVRDAQARPVPFSVPARVELGGDVHAVLEFERAPPPWSLVRAVVAPIACTCAALVLLLAVHHHHRRRYNTARPTAEQPETAGDAQARVLAFASLSCVPLAFAFTVKALIAYAVIVHPPQDWKAFDQLLVSSLGLAFAVFAGTLIGLFGLPWPRWRLRLARSTGLWLVLVMLALARFVLSIFGREQLGELRLVVVLPLIAALIGVYIRSAFDPQQRERMSAHPLVVTLTSAIAVLAWIADKGALLVLFVPVVAALGGLLLVELQRHRGTKRIPYLVMLSLAGLTALIVVTVPDWMMYGWIRLLDRSHVTALDPASSRFCRESAPRTSAAAQHEADDACDTPVATLGESPLDTMAAQGLLDPKASVAERRHPLRRLDWYNDGRHAGRCRAADRLPTRDALEVGHFRALTERYRARGDRERRYLQPDLLPFPRGTTDALLFDYLGVVELVPQLPRGVLVAVALSLLLLWLLALATSRTHTLAATDNGWLAAGEAALGLLAGCAVLTVSANLDVYPNFAQSLPLLALRSHAAWLLDGIALFVALACLGTGWRKASAA